MLVMARHLLLLALLQLLLADLLVFRAGPAQLVSFLTSYFIAI